MPLCLCCHQSEEKAEPKERGRKHVKTNIKFFPVLIYPDQEGSREERKSREERRRKKKRKKGEECVVQRPRDQMSPSSGSEACGKTMVTPGRDTFFWAQGWTEGP